MKQFYQIYFINNVYRREKELWTRAIYYIMVNLNYYCRMFNILIHIYDCTPRWALSAGGFYPPKGVVHPLSDLVMSELN